MKPLRPEMTLKQGAFRLLRLLGSGGQAQVWRALKITEAFHLEMQVALKILRPKPELSLSQLQQQILSFREEARLSECLRHSQHFVSVRNAFEDKEHNLLGLEMEIVEGMDFFDLLHEHREQLHQPLPWMIALSLGSQLYEGLYHAHTATQEDQPLHLIHRDIKPQNLMLSTTGIVKLLDLGIAKWEQRDIALQTLEAKPKGSFTYMAPEQALYAKISPQSDIFSAGAVLYEMITGKQLFGAKLYHEHLTHLASLAQQPPPSAHEHIPSLPREVSVLLSHFLAAAPEDRPKDALAAKGQIDTLLKTHQAYLGPGELQAWVTRLYKKQGKPLSKTTWYGLPPVSDPTDVEPSIKPSQPFSHASSDATLPEMAPITWGTKEATTANQPLGAPTSEAFSASSRNKPHTDTLPSQTKPLRWLGLGAGLVLVCFLLWGSWRLFLSEQSRRDAASDPLDASAIAQRPDETRTSPQKDDSAPTLDGGVSVPARTGPIARHEAEPTEKEIASLDAGQQPAPPPIRRRKRRRRPFLRRTQRPIVPEKDRPTVEKAPEPPARRRIAEPVLPKEGLVEIRVEPFGCLLRGPKASHGFGKAFSLALPLGRHRFRCIHRKKFFLWVFSVDVKPGKQRIEKKVEMGQLFLRSKPWSTVLLSPFGEIGQSHAQIPLPVGRHRLTLYRQGQSTQVREISVSILPDQVTQPPFVRW